MSENDFSKNIKRAILKFAKSKGKKYVEIREEPTIYLKAPKETVSFYQFPYNPEVCLTKKCGTKHKHIIFEVLDSQGKQPNLIIADIIQAMLVDNANMLIFFTKNKKDKDRAEELSNTISGLLTKRVFDTAYEANKRQYVKISKKYAYPDWLVYEITEEQATDEKYLNNFFNQKSKENNW